MGRGAGKRLVYDVGVSDVAYVEGLTSYTKWSEMLRRCYSKAWHKRSPSYVGCYVCDEWLTFSNFKLWYDAHYVEGYQLDKDLFIAGNKIYSPQTCFFVLQQLNLLLVEHSRSTKNLKGVCEHKGRGKSFQSYIKKHGKEQSLGYYHSAHEAHEVYVEAKRAYILEEVARYRKEGIVAPKLLDALEARYVNHN